MGWRAVPAAEVRVGDYIRWTGSCGDIGQVVDVVDVTDVVECRFEVVKWLGPGEVEVFVFDRPSAGSEPVGEGWSEPLVDGLEVEF